MKKPKKKIDPECLTSVLKIAAQFKQAKFEKNKKLI